MSAVLANLSAVTFLRPQWLWLLVALPLLAWLLRRRQRRASVWRDLVDPHLLPHLLQARSGTRGSAGTWLALLGAALAIAALAGPSWQRVEQPLWQSQAPLVIALDLSPTITASDLPPSRLSQARAKIDTLLQARAGGQVGLVAFAEDAYTVAPLTDDAANVALFLPALAPDIMPGNDSADAVADAARAIDWSAGLLRQAGFAQGDIVLLTDHADGRAQRAAAAAAGAGYRVSVLGLGTDAGAAYRDGVGRIAQARLDAASLRALARSGDGRYAALRADSGDLAAVGVLDPSQAGTVAAHGEKTRVWRDQGYWLLLPVLLLGALAFRRGGALAALLLCVLLPLAPARAADTGWWRRPDQQQHRQLVQGAEAYRRKDYAAAEQAWRGLPGAEAAYNLGNALARQGKYEAAIAQYDKALRLQPGMADAEANRRAVAAALKRRPPKGGKPGQQPQPDQDGKDQSGEEQSGRHGDRGQGAPQDGSSSGKPADSDEHAGDRDKSETPPQAQAGADAQADREAQRRADAAQRARMQAALRKKQGEGEQAAPAHADRKIDETPAQRERRIANEAWLRRVPDDPGGLLRARFQLEHDRRLQGDH